MDKNIFADPGKSYRGVTLWMLNDKLEVNEIARQLEGLHDAGWGAVITRTFNGLLTEYLSEEWMQILDQIVNQASDLDMKVWFQAGYMPSAMPNLDPDMAHQMLTRKEKGEKLLNDERVLAEDDEYVYVERKLGHVLNLLDPIAADNYLKKSYEETWLDRFGQHFGDTIEAVWVDEPHFRPPLLPWSKELPARFEAKWGYSLSDHLPSLFMKHGDFKMIRHHYWRVVTDMFLEGYYAPVGEWCQANNIKFSGHLMGEDTLNNQVAFTGATMPCYEYMQLPGIDHLTMSLRWPTGKKFLLTPKQCVSASHQLGKKLILAEMYAVSSQGITFEDRKQIAEWLMVLGINYRCYHGSFYSLRGRRKRIYPPHLSHQQPWWSENKVVADYFARLSYALRQGDYQADVMVLHSVESAYCLYDTLAMAQPHNREIEAEDVKELDARLVNLCDNLLSIQRSFDFGDETLLDKYGEVTEDGLKMGEMLYKVVILPDMLTIRESTLSLLKAFADAGGKIIAVGELPERIDGIPNDNVDELVSIVDIVANEPVELTSALTEIPTNIEVIAAEGSDVSSVWVHSRKLDDSKLYYLHNTNRYDYITADIRIYGKGNLERWDMLTGEVEQFPQRVEDNKTVATLSFPPLGSYLLILKENEYPDSIDTKKEQITRQIDILHQPTITRHDPNALTLDYCRYRKDKGEWSDALPVLTVHDVLTQQEYNGKVSLQFAFRVEDMPSNLCLAIEDAANYEIIVNGHSAEYNGLPYWIDQAFHPVDIVKFAKKGINVVELSTYFSPLPKVSFSLARLFAKREGMELEAIYVIGDFAIKGSKSLAEPKPRCVRFNSDFKITAEQQTTSGDLVSDGYPFYAGRISLAESVNLETPSDGERVVLELPGIDAAALVKVFVNDSEAGAIMWAPYEIDITSLVKSGENQIKLELVSTLRNLLGPHHRPDGELDQCWGTDYTLLPGWLKDEKVLAERWTDDYFFLNFGVAKGSCIKYFSPC